MDAFEVFELEEEQSERRGKLDRDVLQDLLFVNHHVRVFELLGLPVAVVVFELFEGVVVQEARPLLFEKRLLDVFRLADLGQELVHLQKVLAAESL